MSEKRYSPAPWKQYETDDGDVMVKMDDAHEVYIANLEGSCGTCHANASLIAVAPEMLEVCEQTLESLNEFIKAIASKGMIVPMWVNDRKEDLEDVIAKAKGLL